jgi:hypothetical protein
VRDKRPVSPSRPPKARPPPAPRGTEDRAVYLERVRKIQESQSKARGTVGQQIAKDDNESACPSCHDERIGKTKGALRYMEEKGVKTAPLQVPSWWNEEPEEEEPIPKGKGKSKKDKDSQKGKGKKGMKGKDKKKESKGASKGKKGKQKKGKSKDKGKSKPTEREASDSEGDWEEGGSFTGRSLDARSVAPSNRELPPDGAVLGTAASEADWTPDEGDALGALDRKGVTAVERGRELHRIARETHEEIEQGNCVPCWVIVAIGLLPLAIYLATSISAGEEAESCICPVTPCECPVTPCDCSGPEFYNSILMSLVAILATTWCGSRWHFGESKGSSVDLSWKSRTWKS